jgi:beta-lactam-binding protein with PASTA domain
VARPAPRYDSSSEESGDYGWPQPEPRVRSAPLPRPRRRRRSALDGLAFGLALLGLLAAATAAIWYLRLDRTPATHEVVPSVVGLREAVAVTRLTGMGFKVQAVERPGPGTSGTVVSQLPAASTSLAIGAIVTIRVAISHGPSQPVQP